MNQRVRTYSVSEITTMTKSIAILFAVATAVLLPQAVHQGGRLFGVGTGIGEMLLPMHFSILLLGLLAGPYAGAIAGLVAPLISFALTGMPTSVMLPYITIELFSYGMAAGLVADTKLPTVVKVLVAQVAGRAVRAVFILFGVYALGSNVPVAIIWTSITAGIVGIVLQLILLPMLVRAAEAGKWLK